MSAGPNNLVQVNYRVPADLRDAIKARAGELGVEQSVLARRGLEAVLTLDKPLLGDTTSLRGARGRHERKVAAGGSSERDRGKDPAASRSEGSTVELATVLATRTGMPRAVMAHRVRERRVTLNGVVVLEERVPTLGPGDVLALDGAAL